jgi:hypothetical protein
VKDKLKRHGYGRREDQNSQGIDRRKRTGLENKKWFQRAESVGGAVSGDVIWITPLKPEI